MMNCRAADLGSLDELVSLALLLLQLLPSLYSFLVLPLSFLLLSSSRQNCCFDAVHQFILRHQATAVQMQWLHSWQQHIFPLVCTFVLRPDRGSYVACKQTYHRAHGGLMDGCDSQDHYRLCYTGQARFRPSYHTTSDCDRQSHHTIPSHQSHH